MNEPNSLNEGIVLGWRLNTKVDNLQVILKWYLYKSEMSLLLKKMKVYHSTHRMLKAPKGICFIFQKNNHWRAYIVHS